LRKVSKSIFTCFYTIIKVAKDIRLNFNDRDTNLGTSQSTDTNISHVSPIRSFQRHNGASKPINRQFGMSHSGFQNVFSLQNNIDPLDILYDFSSIAKAKRNMQDVYYLLHNIVVTRLGLVYSALGILNTQSNCINLQVLDRIGNSFNARALLNSNQNPIVKAFVDKIPQTVSSNEFLNIDYIPQTKSLVLPMVFQGNCYGVLILGYSELTQQCSDLLQILVDYMALQVANSQISEMSTLNGSTDILTGLKTHRAFQEALSEEITKAETSETDKPKFL